MITPVSSINNIKSFDFAPKTSKNEKISFGGNFTFPASDFYSSLSFLGNRKIPRAEILNSIRQDEPFSNAGYKGVVYKLDYGNASYAVKTGRFDDSDFSKEAEILKKVPMQLSGSQKFVDYFKDPITNRDVLVSTFATGKKDVLKEGSQFEEFFNNLFVLDKSGVLHGDLNMQNCLFDGDKINLIDFGEGSLFKAGDKYDEMYPSFMVKSNAVNLEQNGIPDCIQKWNEEGLNVKETFKKYLKAKGEFYSAHADYLEQKGADTDAVSFERNLGEVLKNPDDKIIENEVRRIDVLHTFEHSDTAVNYTKIPRAAIRNWNLTVSKTKNMLDFINSQLDGGKLDNKERTYFKYQKKVAQTMLKDYEDWSHSTIEWIKSVLKKSSSSLTGHELELLNNRDKTMKYPPDLCDMVLS